MCINIINCLFGLIKLSFAASTDYSRSFSTMNEIRTYRMQRNNNNNNNVMCYRIELLRAYQGKKIELKKKSYTHFTAATKINSTDCRLCCCLFVFA